MLVSKVVTLSDEIEISFSVTETITASLEVKSSTDDVLVAADTDAKSVFDCSAKSVNPADVLSPVEDSSESTDASRDDSMALLSLVAVVVADSISSVESVLIVDCAIEERSSSIKLADSWRAEIVDSISIKVVFEIDEEPTVTDAVWVD